MAKEIEFWGSSKADLRSFPEDARRELGFQLRTVQNGFEPAHWRSMSTVGAGVKEIKVKDASGEFRALYAASFETAIHVLHAFQKKSQKTSKSDIDLAKKRLKEVVKDEQRRAKERTVKR